MTVDSSAPVATARPDRCRRDSPPSASQTACGLLDKVSSVDHKISPRLNAQLTAIRLSDN